jgi:hypothetical protein
MSVVWFARAVTKKKPKMGTITSLQTARAMMEAMGSRETGRGMRICRKTEGRKTSVSRVLAKKKGGQLTLARALPKTSKPSGTEAFPMKVAVSRMMARGGSPSGAVGRQL